LVKTLSQPTLIRELNGDFFVSWVNCNENSQIESILSSLTSENQDEKSYYNPEISLRIIEAIERNKTLLILDDYHQISKKKDFQKLILDSLKFLKEGKIIVVTRVDISSENNFVKKIVVKGVKNGFNLAKAIIRHSFEEEFSSFEIKDAQIKKICELLKGHPLSIELTMLLISEGESPNVILEKIKNNEKVNVNNFLLEKLFDLNSFSYEEIEFLDLLILFRGATNLLILKYLLPEYIFISYKPLIKKNIIQKENNYLTCHLLIKEFFHSKSKNIEANHLKIATFFENTKNQDVIKYITQESLIYHYVKANKWNKVKEILSKKEIEDLLKDNKRLQLEKKIKELSQKIVHYEQMNSDLKSFSYAATHDLKEPLRLISSYIGLLKMRNTSASEDERNEYLNIIAKGAERMRLMLEGLLNYTIIGSETFESEDVDLNEVLEKTISINLKFEIDATQAIISFNDLPIIKGNFSSFVSLFQNLISNSVKYCDKKIPIVSIKHEPKVSSHLFVIEDNGIGIADEHKDRIFDIFTRINNNDVNKSGTGIGLSICKKIIRNLNGKIWVTSEIGVGSIFFIEIPK